MSSPRREYGDALRCGDRSAAVTEIRATLASLGLLASADEDLSTGRHVALELFDAELDQAVRAFQQHRGLLVDGIVGKRPTGRSRRRPTGSAPARCITNSARRFTATTSRRCRPGCRISVSTPAWSTATSGCRPTTL